MTRNDSKTKDHYVNKSIFQDTFEYTTERGEYRVMKRGPRCYQVFYSLSGPFIHSHYAVTKKKPDPSDLRAFHYEVIDANHT